MNKPLFSIAVFGLASLGFANELVNNGNFEATPSNLGWTEASSGNFILIGDWSTSIVDSVGDFGPATNTAWLGGANDEVDTITQSVLTPNSAVTAFLDFDYQFTDEDIPLSDFFDVSLGGSNVFSTDIGGTATGTLSGVIHKHINVLSLMNGTSKALVFKLTTDSSLSSSVFVDNVKLTTTPEPATFAVLGLGAIALIRRRKKS